MCRQIAGAQRPHNAGRLGLAKPYLLIRVHHLKARLQIVVIFWKFCVLSKAK